VSRRRSKPGRSGLRPDGGLAAWRRSHLRAAVGGRPHRAGALTPWVLLGVLSAVVAAVVLAAHWPALSAQALSFDDNQYLTENPLVQNPSRRAAKRFLTEVLEPSTVRGYYQPLAMISLMVDHALGGRVDDLRPFHRTSLCLHVANTLLVVVLMYLLFDRLWMAAVAGLLFGVHPLTVEPIPWVGERKTLLTTFFALWCLILYVRYTRSSCWKSYAGATAMYVLALLSKPTSTPLPLLMLLLDYWPIRRLGARAVLEKVPLFAIAFASAVITYISQARTAAVATPAQYSMGVIPLTLCHNILFYACKMIWPTHLSTHYPYPEPFGIGQPMVLVGVVGTCMLIPALLISWRWTRAFLVSWLFFFVAILPTMGVVGFTHSIASDKYAYLPSVGALLLLTWGMSKAWDALGRRPGHVAEQVAMVIIVLIVAGSEIVATRRCLTHWQDSERHFRHMLALSPNARILHFGLAEALRLKAQSHRSPLVPSEAVEHYRLALREGRDSPFGRNDLLTCSAHNNLGNALAQRGDVDQAMFHWGRVLQLNPGDFNAHNNLGIALAWKGRPDEAIRHYVEALRLRPDLPETHFNLGIELARKGQIDAAIEHYRESLRLNPRFALAYRNLAPALVAKGRDDLAIDAYHRALQLQPVDPDARCKLGKLFSRQGQVERAIGQFQEALRLDPHNQEARRGLEALGKDKIKGPTSSASPGP
jgi:tetratricopeptide (TPR) repeat protein